MKTRTVIVLNDGSEITMEGSDCAYVGLQCPICLTKYELHAHHTRAQVEEIVALHKKHITDCNRGRVLAASQPKRIQ